MQSKSNDVVTANQELNNPQPRQSDVQPRPRPHKFTIRLSDYEWKLIGRLSDQLGIAKTSVFRLGLRQIAKLERQPVAKAA
jgi:hypothetical protein